MLDSWEEDKSPGDLVKSDDYDERTARIKKALAGGDVGTFADLDTTPSVSNKTVWHTANTGLTTITDFDDETNKLILIRFDDALTTIAHNANIKLAGGRLFGPVPEFSRLLLDHDGTQWCEISRSINGTIF